MRLFYTVLLVILAGMTSLANEAPDTLIIKSKEFLSPAFPECDGNFMCFTGRLQNGINPSSMNRYTGTLAPGIQFDCALRSAAMNVLKTICQISIDPSKSTSDVLISVSNFSEAKVVRVEITNQEILSKIRDAADGLYVIHNSEQVSIPGSADGNGKLERMELTCVSANSLSLSSCTLTGVVN